MKLFFFDCETTGLDPVKNDIIQIAFIIEIAGVVKEKLNYKCQPFSFENCEPKALEVNKTSVGQLHSYPTPQSVYTELITILTKYINKYDRADKFTPCGFNVDFDIGFLKNFFTKNNDPYFGSWFQYKSLDTYAVGRFMAHTLNWPMKSHKLIDFCAKEHIMIDAHDALSDIEATRELFYKLQSYIKR